MWYYFIYKAWIASFFAVIFSPKNIAIVGSKYESET